MLSPDRRGRDRGSAYAACLAAPAKGLPRASLRRRLPVMDLVLLALSLAVCAALTAGFIG